ncbi:MAG: MotA/TolQ/ExbB proton channel family protein [Kiritimatiellae bacterium]|nr:MotA/TolQ/ExbB proton channel family protein [Kiritimatiellia bacterium]
MKLMQEGGWVMWPIVALSVVGLAVALERLWRLSRFLLAREADSTQSPQQQLNDLQRGFGLISTIITAEPMLGILGTVTGIIKTFGAFKLSDAASPLAATAGIGEALVTTAAGLVAALVLLFPYNLLLGLLARAAVKLESAA